MINFFLPVLVGLPSVLATSGGHCPPTGPVLPQPAIPSNIDLSKLNSQFERIVHNASESFNTTENSFSVLLTTKNGTLYQYHHSAPVRDPAGVKKVDGDSVYRVCSVTKVFNVLTLLLNAGKLLDAPVTAYVPELEGNKVYEDVTLRMLTSQISGVPRRGYAFDRATTNPKTWEDGGFPVPDKKDLPPCDIIGGDVCSRAQFFENLKRNQLMWLPGDKVAYSDQAYILLGMVMQNITGKPFSQLLHDSVTKPLDMPITGFTQPNHSKGVISLGAGRVLWDQSIGNFNATAGLFSTPNELGTFVRAIMNHKLLSAAKTRQWMHSAEFAGSFSMFVGAPWEIMRISNLTPDNRSIDIYTKSGSMPGWGAYIFILPDYDVGGVIAVSGDAADPASLKLLDMITTTVVPIVDGLARQQARKTYGGQYVAKCGDNACKNEKAASLELVVDNGPGLKIKSWVNNGKSIVKTLASSKGVKPEEVDLRLYPVGEDDRWRLGIETLLRKPDVARKPSDVCMNWFQVDSMRWATLPIDEFDFEIKGGRVAAVKNLGLRANLTKIH